MTERTLQQLRAMKPGKDRIQAANEYIEKGQDKINEARRLRNDDIRKLIEEVGPAAAAKQTGMKLPTIRAIKGGA